MKRIATTATAARTAHAHATTDATVPEKAAPVAAGSATPAAPSAPPTSGVSVAFIAPPPSNATIPVPPSGWVPRPGEDYRGTQPKKAELSTVAGAIDDLRRFTSYYATTLGSTAPPLTHVIQLFEAGSQWSASRVATANWDVYARAQEGLAWGGIRALMDTLRPAFDLAVTNNSALATQFPSLTSLLTAQKVIARKGASTRRANDAKKAAGELPAHGKVGKARQRAAEKAALAAATAEAASPAAGSAAPGSPSGGASAPPTQVTSPTTTGGHS